LIGNREGRVERLDRLFEAGVGKQVEAVVGKQENAIDF